jgi:hypothetical protein
VGSVYVGGDRLDREELYAALGAAEALLAGGAGAPMFGGHVGLAADLQRELLPAEPAIVLCRGQPLISIMNGESRSFEI